MQMSQPSSGWLICMVQGRDRSMVYFQFIKYKYTSSSPTRMSGKQGGGRLGPTRRRRSWLPYWEMLEMRY